MADSPRHDADRTLDVYERRARDWQQQRGAELDNAEEFTRSLDAEQRPVVDLGCGPGWHLPALPAGAIAMDAAASMLALSTVTAPQSPPVQADLAALPFARHSVGAAWANKSYVHLDRRALPLAWWDLHRVLRVGSPAFLGLFEGDADHIEVEDDDFPGRRFSLWTEPLLRHVLAGAGFDVELIVRGGSGDDHLGVWVRRLRTLADTVGPGMRLLMVGLNPSLHAADAGVGFYTAGNRAWPALRAAGLTTTDRDPLGLLIRDGIGMTDLVKDASPGAGDLTADQYRAGIERLDVLCAWLRPAAVCIVGLAGWRSAVDRKARVGHQAVRLGGRPVYLMPNPSGLNTHVTVSDLADHFGAAAALADLAELADPPGAD